MSKLPPEVEKALIYVKDYAAYSTLRAHIEALVKEMEQLRDRWKEPQKCPSCGDGMLWITTAELIDDATRKLRTDRDYHKEMVEEFAFQIEQLKKEANCPVYGSEDPCTFAEQLEAYEAVMDMLDTVGGMPTGVRLAYNNAKKVRD